MTRLTFAIDIDDSNHARLKQYSTVQLNGFAEFAFEKWYNEQYNNNFNMDGLQSKINEGLEPTINKLFGISKSVEKGKVFEYILEETIETHFKECKYIDMASINHVGDGLLTLENGSQCIIEAKNYLGVVPRHQIEKLKNDMKTTGICNAIMLTTGTIVGKQFFDIESFDNNHIIFVSNYFDNPLLHLRLAITVTKHLTHVEIMSWDVLQRMSHLNSTINSVTKLKTDYIALEKSIKNGLDSYYLTLREYESDVKLQINNIIDSTLCTNELIIKKQNNSMLDRLYHEIFLPHKLKIFETEDICIYSKKIEIIKIKILKNSSLQILCIYPISKFTMTSDNYELTIKLLKVMMEPYLCK